MTVFVCIAAYFTIALIVISGLRLIKPEDDSEDYIGLCLFVGMFWPLCLAIAPFVAAVCGALWVGGWLGRHR
jgi:hypothetical protein